MRSRLIRSMPPSRAQPTARSTFAGSWVRPSAASTWQARQPAGTRGVSAAPARGGAAPDGRGGGGEGAPPALRLGGGDDRSRGPFPAADLLHALLPPLRAAEKFALAGDATAVTL